MSDNTMTQAQISELIDLKVKAALTNFAVTLPTLSDMHQIALLELNAWVKNKAEIAKLDLLSAELQKEMDKLAAVMNETAEVKKEHPHTILDFKLCEMLHECGLLKKDKMGDLSQAARESVWALTTAINRFFRDREENLSPVKTTGV